MRTKAIWWGANLSAQNVALTASVTQRASEKIAMTAPVTQQGDGEAWRVRFVMPANYTMEALPMPRNPAVALKDIEGKRFAVIRFSGMAGETSLERHMDELKTYLGARNFTSLAAPTYAFYNPPWTLPFLRRNEIMIEIAH